MSLIRHGDHVRIWEINKSEMACTTKIEQCVNKEKSNKNLNIMQTKCQQNPQSA